MNPPKVAVVILNWNGKHFLEKFLPSVISHSNNINYSVWIADNNSTDDSVNFLKNNFPQINIIEFDKNYGFALGYNKALEQIDAQYFVLLNSDVEVTPNWISPIIEFMDQNPQVAVVQPKILSYNNKKMFEYAGAAGGFIDTLGYPFCKGRILNKLEEDNGQYNKIDNIFWATGACFFIRKEEFLENKFDPDLFAHMEEIDLCWRLKNKRKKIVYFPYVQVYHLGGGSLPNNSPFKLYLNYRNNLLVLYKNLPKNKTFTKIFFRMFFDGLSAIIYILRFEFKNFFAVLKAHIHFYKLLPKFKAKRKLQLKTNSFSHTEIYKKNIVFDFYFKKKSIFTVLNFQR